MKLEVRRSDLEVRSRTSESELLPVISQNDSHTGMMIPAVPNRGIRSLVLALPFRPLYNNMSLLSRLRFLGISILNVQECQSCSQCHGYGFLLQT